MLVTGVLALGFFIAAPVLCGTFFGEAFSGSTVQLRVLVTGAFGMVAVTVLGNALVARNRPVLSSISLAVGFACTLVLDILLIPPYAGIGAAVASAIAYTAAGVAMAFFFTRALGAKATDLIPRLREAGTLLADGRGSIRRRARMSRSEEELATDETK
jgi:O-antigen/teichoic acid export membrane protein